MWNNVTFKEKYKRFWNPWIKSMNLASSRCIWKMSFWPSTHQISDSAYVERFEMRQWIDQPCYPGEWIWGLSNLVKVCCFLLLSCYRQIWNRTHVFATKQLQCNWYVMRLSYLTILLLRQKRWLMVRINSKEFPSMKLKYLYPHFQPTSRSLESKHFWMPTWSMCLIHQIWRNRQTKLHFTER